MSKIVIIGAGAMGSAFALPCLDNNHVINLVGTHLENNFIENLKKDITDTLKTDVNFRRVENVGPKVSQELLRDGLTAIALALAAMLFYIWIRFEWQFSLGSIVALIQGSTFIYVIDRREWMRMGVAASWQV